MGEALRVNTVLQTLGLSHNDPGDVGGKAVGEALRVKTVLQTLDLSWNRLGKVGGKAVSEAQSVNTVLESLLMDVEEEEGLFHIRDIRKL